MARKLNRSLRSMASEMFSRMGARRVRQATRAVPLGIRPLMDRLEERTLFSALTLSNGNPGAPGTLQVTVDEYGSFGADFVAQASVSDTVFTPITGVPSTGTTRKSVVYFSATDNYLTTDTTFTAQFGQPITDLVTGFVQNDPRMVTSNFTLGSGQYTVQLVQSLSGAGAYQTLSQTYTVTNNFAASTPDFAIVRYTEAQLASVLGNIFDPSDIGAVSGDGHLIGFFDQGVSDSPYMSMSVSSSFSDPANRGPDLNLNNGWIANEDVLGPLLIPSVIIAPAGNGNPGGFQFSYLANAPVVGDSGSDGLIDQPGRIEAALQEIVNIPGAGSGLGSNTITFTTVTVFSTTRVGDGTGVGTPVSVTEFIKPGTVGYVTGGKEVVEGAAITLSPVRKSGLWGTLSATQALFSSGTATLPGGTNPDMLPLTPQQSSLLFPDGSDFTQATSTAQQIIPTVITTVDDNIIEGIEAFSVFTFNPLTFNNQATVDTTNNPFSIFINDNDTYGTFSVQSAATVAENAGTVSLTVNRTAGSTGVVSITYFTTDGTADGQDYNSVAAPPPGGAGTTITFASGETTQTITLSLIDDVKVENQEDFTLQIQLTPSGTTGQTLGSLGNSLALINITDDDDGGQVSLATATATVGEAAGNLTLTFNRAFSPGKSSGFVLEGGAVDYQFGISSDTATPNADYQAIAGTVVFGIGETTKTVQVPIVDDLVAEATEVFTVQLAQSSNINTNGATVDLTKASTAVTITDNDVGGTVSLVPTSLSIAENGTAANLTILRTGGSAIVSVIFATADGTALAGQDYTAANTLVTFASGETSKAISIPITNDLLTEGDETFTVSLVNPGAGLVIDSAAGSATVTILASDSFGNTKLSAGTYTIGESGGFVPITVDRTGGSDNPITVNYTTVDGTATAGSDYAVTAGTLNFAAGETRKTFNVNITSDNLEEGSEAFSIQLSNQNFGTLGSPAAATVTITDDDTAGTASFASTAATVAENSGTAVFTILRSGGSSGDVQLSYTTADGTATAGQDYVATSGTLTFLDGETVKSLSVPITDDALEEGAEAFSLVLSNPTNNLKLGSATSTVTIPANDTNARLQFSATAVSVAEGSGNLVLTVTRTTTSTGAVGVSFSTAGITAADGSDFTPTSGTLAFADGETSKTITVPIVDDSIIEAAKTFSVTLSSPTGAAILGTDSVATVTIADDDNQFSFSSSSYTVAENVGSAIITVNRAGNLSLPATVAFGTTDGSAVSGTNYTGNTGSLTFAAGESTKSFNIAITDDPQTEGPARTFSITLTNPSGTGASLASPTSAVVSITNVDRLGPKVTNVRTIAPTKKIERIVLNFSEGLDAAGSSLASNYQLLAADKKGNYTKPIRISSVTYDPSTTSITLIPFDRLAFNQAYQLTVLTGAGLKDLSGQALNANRPGTSGTNFVSVFARGTSLKYIDGIGNKVVVTLKKGGQMELIRGLDSAGDILRLTNTVSGKSTLSGSVKAATGVAGKTTYSVVSGILGVINKLPASQFEILTTSSVS